MEPPLTNKASHTNMQEDCLNFLKSCEFNRCSNSQIEALTFGSIRALWHTKRKVMMNTEEKNCLKTLSVKYLRWMLAKRRSVEERRINMNKRVSSQSVTPSTEKTQENPLTPLTPSPMLAMIPQSAYTSPAKPAMIPQSAKTSPAKPAQSAYTSPVTLPTRRLSSCRDMFEDSTVLESLLDTSQQGAGYNTQMGLALSISMVSVWGRMADVLC